jgi:plasmid stabilization system protein ParE
MKVVFTPESEQQADEMDTWWRSHRQKAPGLFARELAEVRESIAGTPTLGGRHRTRSGRVAQRLLIPKTRTHVYFEVDEEQDTVVVLAVWGAPRRRSPRL